MKKLKLPFIYYLWEDVEQIEQLKGWGAKNIDLDIESYEEEVTLYRVDAIEPQVDNQGREFAMVYAGSFVGSCMLPVHEIEKLVEDAFN